MPSAIKTLLQSFAVMIVGGTAIELTARVMDPRPTKLQMLHSLRQRGEQAVVAASAQQVLHFTQGSGLTEGLLPLGGVSGRTTVFCQEEDEFLVYRSDRHGFFNPDSVWEKGKADIAVVGDSFAQGACVPEGTSASDQLRKGGRTVLNLGAYSNGPLTQLASIREYLPEKRPKVVYWFYVPNDLRFDFEIERGSKLLMRYADNPQFAQGLAKRQKEVDRELSSFLDKTEVQSAGERSSTWTKAPAYLQRKLQQWLRPPPTRSAFVADYDGELGDLDFPLFAKVLQRARAEVNAWNGHLVFVFIPDAQMFAPENRGGSREAINRLHERVMLFARASTDEVIDMYSELKSVPRPFDLYTPLGTHYGHFNRAGYRLLAEALNARSLSDKPLSDKRL